MKKIYSFFSALMIGTACLFAQTAPDGYIAMGAFTESFTNASNVSAMGWGWGWQNGSTSVSYSTSSSSAVNGKYINTSSFYLQTDQTTPTAHHTGIGRESQILHQTQWHIRMVCDQSN